MKSLTGLIYEKAELNNIDPDASGLFRGKILPNIMGHRDVGKTACRVNIHMITFRHLEKYLVMHLINEDTLILIKNILMKKSATGS